mmetsp:Transcript_32206/g.37274  ORF Transcript_32206/g.37274 Transcript_32206/m.37274 type:complete len:357 (+) Transcript_32206:200-1270(+)
MSYRQRHRRLADMYHNTSYENDDMAKLQYTKTTYPASFESTTNNSNNTTTNYSRYNTSSNIEYNFDINEKDSSYYNEPQHFYTAANINGATYGCMFDVITMMKTPIRITSIDIYHSNISTKTSSSSTSNSTIEESNRSLVAEVYTHPGTFRQEYFVEDWEMIYRGRASTAPSTFGNNHYGNSSSYAAKALITLAPHRFTNTTLEPGSMHTFHIALSSPELGYWHDESKPTGSQLMHNYDMKVLVGVGIRRHPFFQGAPASADVGFRGVLHYVRLRETETPSSVPSALPSVEHSKIPSRQLSKVPSQTPSETHSLRPSRQPSKFPSHIPSVTHSLRPSKRQYSHLPSSYSTSQSPSS